MIYVTLSEEEKLKLLREHHPEGHWPDLHHEQWCLHCEKKFSGQAVRIWRDGMGDCWLECGTPGCNGSPIDWAPFPWWDETHPLTQEQLRKQEAGEAGSGGWIFQL